MSRYFIVKKLTSEKMRANESFLPYFLLRLLPLSRTPSTTLYFFFSQVPSSLFSAFHLQSLSSIAARFSTTRFFLLSKFLPTPPSQLSQFYFFMLSQNPYPKSFPLPLFSPASLSYQLLHIFYSFHYFSVPCSEMSLSLATTMARWWCPWPCIHAVVSEPLKKLAPLLL